MKQLLFRPDYLVLNFSVVLLFFMAGCRDGENHSQTSQDFLKENVEWLASDDLEGRLAGTINEAEAANYIADRFLQFGIVPAGDDETYFQEFLLSGPVVQAMNMENHMSRNIVGIARGTRNPDQFIILGAHYDSQGMGGVISMGGDTEPAIHNGADDNASGTAGLLYLAKQFAENPVEKSVLLVAFSGEEMGLIGSRHFAGNMEMSRDSVLAMINFDMIGRLNEQDLTIFGTGTSDIWGDVLESVVSDSLVITTVPSGSGSSDHAAFYEEGIPALHYFTGIHSDYHRETDTPEKINYDGMEAVLNHAEQAIRELSRYSADEIDFTEATDPRERVMQREGVTLGVLPDYSYSGEGFRIEGIREGQAADNAGILEGDIIIRMGEEPVNDIYDYMELLGGYEDGDTVLLAIRRGDEEIELDVIF